MRGSQIPDFTRLPWKKLDTIQVKIPNPKKDGVIWVCTIEAHINEDTGSRGEGLIMAGYAKNSQIGLCAPYFILWERKLFTGGNEKSLYYVAYSELDEWSMVRMPQLGCNFKIDFDRQNNPSNVTIVFDTITGDERCFPFPYRIV